VGATDAAAGAADAVVAVSLVAEIGPVVACSVVLADVVLATGTTSPAVFVRNVGTLGDLTAVVAPSASIVGSDAITSDAKASSGSAGATGPAATLIPITLT